MERTVDIVVIGCNEGRLLRETLQSALTAAARFKEKGNPAPKIVYVDSRSTDDSVEIARSLGIDVHMVEGLTTPPNGRATGMDVTSGNYVMFLDGDTLLDPDWLMAAVLYLEAKPLVAGVGGQLDWVVLRNGEVIASEKNWWNTRSDGEQVTDGVGGNFLYKRAVLDRAGGWNRYLKRNGEFELHLRIAHCGYKLQRLAKPMGVHRDEKTGDSWGFAKRFLLTRRLFDSGRLTRSAPLSLGALHIIFRRYWLFMLHPILVVTILLSIFAAWKSGQTWLWALAVITACFLCLCHLMLKRFDIKHATASLITMNFYSFGWYAGLFMKPMTTVSEQ